MNISDLTHTAARLYNDWWPVLTALGGDWVKHPSHALTGLGYAWVAVGALCGVCRYTIRPAAKIAWGFLHGGLKVVAKMLSPLLKKDERLYRRVARRQPVQQHSGSHHSEYDEQGNPEGSPFVAAQ